MTSSSLPRDGIGPTETPWTGRWIWSDDDGQGPNAWRWFRAEFPAAHGTAAVLRITAETRYRTWVNGRQVGDGPAQSVPWWMYYDEYQIADLLVDGQNCVAVLVNSTGCYPQWTRGGLLAEVVEGSSVLTASGSGWRVHTADSFRSGTTPTRTNKLRPFAVVEDTRREPEGWRLAGYDDTGWHPAGIIGRGGHGLGGELPWNRLVRRDIPDCWGESVRPMRLQTVEECLDLDHRIDPGDLAPGLSQVGRPPALATFAGVDLLVRPKGTGTVDLACSTGHLTGEVDGVYDPCLTLDFGTIQTARVEVEVEGPSGAIIEIGYAERLIDEHFTIAIEGGFADRVVLRGGRQRVVAQHWHTFRYVRFRLRRCSQPLRLHDLAARIFRYPFRRHGTFHSGDATLDAVFRISRGTLQLCSVDAIVDGWRESAQWLGDAAAVAIGGIYSCFGDTALPAKFLRQSAACQLPSGLLAGYSNVPSLRPDQAFADYSLWWILAVWNHYRYTGDESWLHRCYGQVLRVIEAFAAHLTGDGLLAGLSGPVFIDWVPIDRHGANSTVNAMFAHALLVVRAMADIKHDEWMSERARTMRERLLRSFQDHFYDRERGVVVDSPVGQGADRVSEHGNAAAVLWGLLDREAAERVVRELWVQRSVRCTEAEPFFTSVVLQALAAVGRVDVAVQMVRDRWGRRMVDRGATTTSEEWGINGSWRSGEYHGFMRSMSHAWSAYPAEFLTRVLPGLEIAEPGCGRLRLVPRTIDLTYTSRWAIPQGVVTVEHGAHRMTVTVPAGVAIETDPADSVTVRTAAVGAGRSGLAVAGDRMDPS